MSSMLLQILTGRSEDLGVEYKAWMDTSVPETRAKLARHVAALANHGGGYLVFGVDDASRLPQGQTELPRSMFSQDAMNGIAKRYLEPRVQVRMDEVEHLGVLYPVFTVPSHGARPVVAVADGPQDGRGGPVGVRQGEIYVRRSGPESVRIAGQDDWNALLDRCLSKRSDLLGNILRQTISRPTRPATRALDFVASAMGDTADDFVGQVRQAASQGAADLGRAADNLSVLGYAFLGDGGEILELEGVRALNERTMSGMSAMANNGWSSFIAINVPERAPRMRYSEGGEESAYLEGMRLADAVAFWGTVDYWRIYERGVAVIAESFREDAFRSGNGGKPYLTVLQVVFRVHSLLAHARLSGQALSGFDQVLVRMDWRGLAGRTLAWDMYRAVSPAQAVDDRLVRSVTLSWSDLRDRYGETLRRVALPVLEAFPSSGWDEPRQWLDRPALERELGRMNMPTVRLFDD